MPKQIGDILAPPKGGFDALAHKRQKPIPQVYGESQYEGGECIPWIGNEPHIRV
jgi:hypothetical protein